MMLRIDPDPNVIVEVAAALKRTEAAFAAPVPETVPVYPDESVKFAVGDAHMLTSSMALVVTAMMLFEPSLVAKLVAFSASVNVAQLPRADAPTLILLIDEGADVRVNATVPPVCAVRVITPVFRRRLELME